MPTLHAGGLTANLLHPPIMNILQGESLPFRHTVHQLMEKLAAAGVGQRPVIFVCHRWGGCCLGCLLPGCLLHA